MDLVFLFRGFSEQSLRVECSFHPFETAICRIKKNYDKEILRFRLFAVFSGVKKYYPFTVGSYFLSEHHCD